MAKQFPAYDPALHGKAKLGRFGLVRIPARPVFPFMPASAQLSLHTGTLHVQAEGGMYLTGSAFEALHVDGGEGQTLALADYKAQGEVTRASIQACPVENSYSGTTSPYHRLVVAGDPDGKGGWIMAQDGRKLVRFDVGDHIPLMSTDPADPDLPALPDDDSDDDPTVN